MQMTIDIEAVNTELAGSTPAEIIAWAAKTFGARLAGQASMQKSAGMIMHLLARIAPDTEVIFIDTGVHFKETLELRDEFARRYGINIRTCVPDESFEGQHARFGRHLYLHDDDKDPPGYRECCRLRKEEPFVRAVRGRFDAVLGGLTRDEGGARAHIRVLSHDPRIDAYKIYPLAHCTEADIDRYTLENGLPVHPLYARGFASIGCETCTTAIKPGEPRRAGRWRHIREANPDLAGKDLYCGINFDDKKG
jgi:phosphoadenosine phosphosulfate reductase